jgi:hypothetical protein
VITRVLVVLNAAVLYLVLFPGTASAACGPSYQTDPAGASSDCGPAQSVVGAAVVAAVVAAAVAAQAATSVARGAALGRLDPAALADALVLAGAAPPTQPAPAQPAPLPLAQAVQLAAQAAQATATGGVVAAQQAAAQGQSDAAQRAAGAAAALVRSAWEAAEAAAQAALGTARAAENRTKGRSSSVRQAARAAFAAASNTADMAASAGYQAQLAADAVEMLAQATDKAQATAATGQLTVAAATAAHAAQAAAENANIADLAAAQAETRAQAEEDALAQGHRPPRTWTSLSQTEQHDGALRAAIPALHTFFGPAYIYGDAAGYMHRSYAAPPGLEPQQEQLAGASVDNPGRQPGKPDVAIHLGNLTYVYEVKSPSKKYGLTERTRRQISGYINAFRALFAPHGVRTDFGPRFPTTVGMDPATGLIYHLWSRPDFPGVIFWAIV